MIPNLESFRVNVTAKDIQSGKPGESSRCAVAKAIARTVPGANNISVDTQSIRFTVGDERCIYLTPDTVANYVIDFDAGDPIVPFRFGMRSPQRMQRQMRSVAAKAAQRANWRKRKGLPAVADPDLPEATTESGNVSEAGEVTLTPGVKRRTVFGGSRSPWGTRSGRRMYGGRVMRYNRDVAAGVINPDGSPVQAK